MSGFDAGRVYSTQAVAVSSTAQAPDAPVQNETALFEFVQNFRLGAEYIYRDRLRSNLLVKQYVLDVQLEHIQMWSPHLAQALRETPAEILSLFEAAVKRSARLLLYPVSAGTERPEAPDCQVTLRSSANLMAMRDLHAENISRLVRIPGIVISTSVPLSLIHI